MRNLESLCYEERLGSYAHLVWRRLTGSLISAQKYLKERCEEAGARFFPVVASNRTRSNCHEPQLKNFHLNMRKNCFT